MGASTLSSRAIIGTFYETLEGGAEAWVNGVSFPVTSNQADEEYRWLGMTPQMREWIGGRQAKGQREAGYKLPNKTFEATLEVSTDDLRRDKTGQILVRVAEMADRANRFKGKLLSDRIIEGAASLCYDGQYFFDTGHSEGKSGSQSNLIDIDISALPVSTHGTPTAPSAAEFSHAVARTVEGMLSLKDDQGEPINEDARSFMVMVPVRFMGVAAMALSGKPLEQGDTSVIGTMDGFTVDVRPNPRLSAWTDQFATFRTDGRVKPFILQEEEEVSMDAIAEGSELEFKQRKHWYGATWIGNVGYGMWQHACLGRLV